MGPDGIVIVSPDGMTVPSESVTGDITLRSNPTKAESISARPRLDLGHNQGKTHEN